MQFLIITQHFALKLLLKTLLGDYFEIPLLESGMNISFVQTENEALVLISHVAKTLRVKVNN